MVNKIICTGCAVCKDICPKGAIKMTADKEGFLYPKINKDLCVDCGACEKVCPSLNKETEFNNIEYYAAKAVDPSLQLTGSSGGVFPVILNFALEKWGGVVWGAAFNEKFSVFHTYGKHITEVTKLTKSKYVQSDLVDCYRNIKRQLSSGQKVIFTGTPCQVTALANFVNNKERKNLLLVEIICHGVPSPAVWKHFLTLLCGERGKRIEDIETIQFKYKDGKSFTWTHPGFCVKWRTGEVYCEYSNKSWYENGFLGNLYVRPSCHNCPMKPNGSKADMSIGDFWGCDKVMPEFHDDSGVSIVIAKTPKGKELLSNIKSQLNLVRIEESVAIAYNPRIVLSSEASSNRKKFWKKYTDALSMNSMEELVQNCTKPSVFLKVKNYIKSKLGKVKKLIFR